MSVIINQEEIMSKEKNKKPKSKDNMYSPKNKIEGGKVLVKMKPSKTIKTI